MLVLPAVLSVMLSPVAGIAGSTRADGTPADMLCVENASERAHVFAAEAPGTARQVGTLQPGERLCVSGAEPGAEGVVSVYEKMDALEGCSRIVAVGSTETMRKYSEFDRCFWGSNS